MADPFQTFLDLIEVERRAEIERNRLELTRLPASVREALGKTVTRLTAEEGDQGEGGLVLVTFSRPQAGEEFAPFHAMNQGDLVAAESPTGQRLEGTLYDVEEYRVVVAVTVKLPDPLPKGRWSLHAVGSDATFKRMRRALQDVRLAATGPGARLREVFAGRAKTGMAKGLKVSFLDPRLNEWQREAVRSALAADDAALVHGPPGTGKTTVLVEIVRQAVAKGQKVLVTAPSNIAVDNLLESLLAHGLRAVRIGHPARTLEALRHATLSARIAAHPDAKRVRDLDRKRERLQVRRSRRADRGQLGWTERHERQREIQSLWREAREIEKALAKEVLYGAQVVCATHGGIAKPLSKGPFDLVVLDEASQATEPLSWIPLLQAKKAVLAGDPMQLPPTLYSEEAAQAGLAFTLFERLMPELPESMKTLLRVQYRMHEAIMRFPSSEFYEDKLIADKSVRAHLISDLRGVRKTALTSEPFHFIDTAGTGFFESWDELLESRENAEEAALAVKILRELLEAGLPPARVAVITPYVAQVRRLKSLIREAEVEVGTVDGFQGREKEAVIVSLVRSNESGEVGFLQDARRLNVALTRARRLLVVIGDSGTISRNPLCARLIEYAGSIQSHRSAWEWLQA